MTTIAPWWWLLAALALMPWIGPWRGSDRLQNLLRSLVFLLLAAALARPYLLQDDAQPQHVLVLDLSESVDADARETALNRAIELASSSRQGDLHLVVIDQHEAGGARIPDTQFRSITRLSSAGLSGQSPLSVALSRAETLIPRLGRGSVILATDGLATRADDSRALSALRIRQIPIQVVPLPTARHESTPVNLTWKTPLRVGQTARMTATVVAHGGGTSGTLILRSEQKELARAAYGGGESERIAMSFEPQQSGFLDAELVIERDGTSGQTQSASYPVVLPVREPYQVLYVGQLQQGGAERLSEVLGTGFRIDQVDPGNVETFRSKLLTSDLIMLDDCPAELIPAAVESQIMDMVANEGLGMVMSGGRSSFAAGGWHERPIETILPVELVQKEEKRDPSTSLVIVIDTSGSMTGVRVQLAKEVARLAMRRLLPHDKVGIVEFYGAKRWAAPIQPASNAIELQRALNRMDAGGGTVILPALEEAFYALQNVETRYKHVLVLTDGGVEAGDFESLTRRMSKEGINVSTVLTGGGYHSEFLVNIANWGKGRFYNVPDRFNLPEVLLKQPSTAKLPTYRPGVHVVRARGAAGWWGEVETNSIPNLAGYVETKARPGSTVLLETTEQSHPIVSTWRYGLGRVTAVGTEPVGEGTRPWANWPDYGQALARILERTAADTRDPFHFRYEHDGGQIVLHAIRQQGRSGNQNGARPLVRIVSSIEGSSDVSELEPRFTARSPNHFVFRMAAPTEQTALRFHVTSSSTPDHWQPLAVPSPVRNETQVDPSNRLDLQQLADSTSGQSIALSQPWTLADIDPGGPRLRPLSSALFAAALLVFLVEILWRRRPQRPETEAA